MMRPPALRLWAVAGLAAAGLAAAIGYWWTRADPGDPRLNAFVRARPPVPVVFTSRTDPSQFPGRRPRRAKASPPPASGCGRPARVGSGS